jgi:hypothetical protein
MLEVEASYSATSIRSYGEGSSGEGRNARARRDGRHHRKHDCWFSKGWCPGCHITQTGRSKRCSAAKETLSNQHPSRYSRTATSRSIATHVLQSWEAGNISVDWGHHVTRSRSQRANQGNSVSLHHTLTNIFPDLLEIRSDWYAPSPVLFSPSFFIHLSEVTTYSRLMLALPLPLPSLAYKATVSIFLLPSQHV